MTKALSPVRNAIISVQNGQAMCSSRDVAAMFGKAHRNVMASIDALTKEGVLFFQETSYTQQQNGQTYTAFDMTKDGFTLLAMGFTGKEALRFKLAYIQRFNEMEAELRQPVVPSSLSTGQLQRLEYDGQTLHPRPQLLFWRKNLSR